MTRFLGERRQLVEGLGRGLPDPHALLDVATQRLDDRSERLLNALGNWLRHRRAEVERLAAGLRPAPLLAEIARGGRDVAGLAGRLGAAMERAVADARRRLDHAARLLDGLSYERVLERGFVLARDRGGRPVTSAAATSPGMDLVLRFHDGETGARVRAPTRSPDRVGNPGVTGPGAAKTKPARGKRAKAPAGGRQGRLL